jgi:hypothetical protein
VAGVSEDTLSTYVMLLEDFGTRNATKSQGHVAAEWIATKFRSYGIDDVEIRRWSATYAGNVVATIPGSVTPDEVYVLGGHYDSIAPEQELEPGADDNASGTATLLECARLLAPHRFAATLQIVAFGAEEYGLIGSEAFAAQASSGVENIVGMINLDMLGYVAPRSKLDLDIISNGLSNWMRDAAHDVAALYVPDLPVKNGKLLRGNSDHSSFWRHGYDAIFFFEDSSTPSPFIHTIDDVSGLSYNNTELHTMSTQTALALLTSLAGAGEVPVTVQSFSLHHDVGAVRLAWRLAPTARASLREIGVQRAAAAAGPYENVAASFSPETTAFVDTDPPADRAWYRLALRAHNGTYAFTSPILASAHLQRTSLEEVNVSDSEESIQIRFRVAAGAGRVQLGVYDVRGRLVRGLVDEAMEPGEYLRTWDERDRRGHTVARGIYFVHLRSLDATRTRKVAVLHR